MQFAKKKQVQYENAVCKTSLIAGFAIRLHWLALQLGGPTVVPISEITCSSLQVKIETVICDSL